MSRSRSLIIVVIFQVLIALFNTFFAIRTLSAGISGATSVVGGEEIGGPPFWAGIMFLCLSIATLFSAYGLWIGQKWGKIVAIATNALLILFGVGDAVNMLAIGEHGFFALFGVYIAMLVTVLVVILRRQPRRLAT